MRIGFTTELLVYNVLLKAQGDRAVAAELFMKRLDRDPELRVEVEREFARVAIDAYASKPNRRKPKKPKNEPRVDQRPSDRTGLLELARGRWLDTKLSTGCRLGSATKPEVLEEAKRLSRSAKWLMAISRRLPDERSTVEQFLTNEDLERLYEFPR